MRLAGEARRLVELPRVQRVARLVSREGSAGLRVEEAPLPQMLQGQVMVRVRAASVNPLDCLMARGYGGEVLGGLGCVLASSRGLRTPPALPAVLGRDFSGEVVARGPGVGGPPLGTEVWGVAPPGSPGSHQQYLAVDPAHLAPKPKLLSHVQAASIPYAGLTAWAAIGTFGWVQQGQAAKVVVLGAGGGVGDLATQILSRHLGAEVTAVCAEDAAERAMVCGARRVVDYKSQSYERELEQIPLQDLVLDCAGRGTGSRVLRELLPLLRPGGRLVSLSSPLLANTDSSGLIAGVAHSLQQLLTANATSLPQGKAVLWGYFLPSQGGLANLGRAAVGGGLAAPPLKCYPLGKVMEAYREVEAGHLRGKVVIDMES